MGHRREIFQREANKGVFQGHKNLLDRNVQICIKIVVLSEHFWGHILGASAVRVSDLIFIYFRFGEAEVSDFDVSIAIEKNVFQFNVSEKDIICM